MLGFGSKPIPLSSDDLTVLRKARTEYQDYLLSIQTKLNIDVKKNLITPETGISINTKIQTSYNWLKNNPNASINEVFSNKDATIIEIQRLATTDIPKRKFFNSITALPIILNDLEIKKQITIEQKKSFLPIINVESSWYTKNKDSATQIDFDQEMMKLQTSIIDIFKNATVVSLINSQLEKAQELSTSTLQSELHKQTIQTTAVINQKVDIQGGVKNMISISMQVFLYCILALICILSGSFLANLAIGRVPAYRILYFIYGCIPFFTPFVLLYAIYTRIRDGRIATYAMLPISIEPGTTRLGRFLWSPFYWIPDQHAIDAFRKFNESLPLHVI